MPRFQESHRRRPSFPMIGGLSPTGQGIAYMTLDEFNRFPAENIIHEVMHALGLSHSFTEEGNDSSNKKHTFKQGRTTNYMDYNNPKKYTCKWQWEILHKSKYAK